MCVKLDDQQWFADMKPESLAYTMSLHSTIGQTCFWQSMRDLELGKRCLCHPHAATCPPPPPGYIDILWGSGPCQPVSQQRRNSTLPEEHKDFSARYLASLGVFCHAWQSSRQRCLLQKMWPALVTSKREDSSKISPRWISLWARY